MIYGQTKKLIIFDFDGVIVDSFAISFGVNRKLGSAVDIDQYRSFFEGNIYEAIKSDSTIKDVKNIEKSGKSICPTTTRTYSYCRDA